MEHARLLAEHGYRVLLYDARGTGASQRRPNGYGWEWDRDERGAVSFLQRQPDVDPHRIGGLGLSTGANVLIEVAATHHDLVAVVSDGATGRSLADLPEISIVERPMQWTTFTAVRLLTARPDRLCEHSSLTCHRHRCCSSLPDPSLRGSR